MDPYETLLLIRKKHINVYGDIFHVTQKHTGAEQRFLQSFIASIGIGIGRNGRRGGGGNNETDFYTGKPVHLIPLVFRFKIQTSGVYVSDIRSLYDYTGDTLTNPYTSEPVSSEDQNRYSKQLRWLSKYRWPISHRPLETPLETLETLKLQQLTINVFTELSQFHYVDYQWFTELSFDDLKRLYYYLYEIWCFRLDLSAEQKRSICADSSAKPICSNYLAVKNYSDEVNEQDKLRRELLTELYRLLSSKNPVAKKEGGIYFLLALVLVSPTAAEAYPSLYAASNY
jgi:hypothetical protein